MLKKLLLGAGLAVSLLLMAGCQTDSSRAIKMQGQSGRMNRNNDFSYYAICNDPSHSTPWKGPLWREKERAMQDAHDHNQTNAGHNAKVESN